MSSDDTKPQVGDLVRDRLRSLEAVVTDIRGGVPILRPRYGIGEVPTWPCPEGIEIIARRGTWARP